MHTSTKLLFATLASLVFTPACDDAEEVFSAGAPTGSRCSGITCWNTAVLAGNDLTNINTDPSVVTNNSIGGNSYYNKVMSSTCVVNSTTTAMNSWDVTAEGELRFTYGANVITGTAVAGCKLLLRVSSTAGMASYTEKTLIVDGVTSVTRESTQSYNYTIKFQTDSVPLNLCPYVDGAADAVLRPGLRANPDYTFQAVTGSVVVGCRGSALSETIMGGIRTSNLSNAGLATADSMSLALVKGGVSYTQTGTPIDRRANGNGVNLTYSDLDASFCESRWHRNTTTGPVCRCGGATDYHRLWWYGTTGWAAVPNYAADIPLCSNQAWDFEVAAPCSGTSCAY